MTPAKTIANGTYAANFIRSSVVPHTIASETAANMNWKMKKEAVSPLAAAPSSSRPNWKRNPVSPASQPPPPKAIANPNAHQTIEATEKLTRILAMPMPAFLPREKPISRNAKPACMKNTSTVPTSTHVDVHLADEGLERRPILSQCSGGKQRGGRRSPQGPPDPGWYVSCTDPP